MEIKRYDIKFSVCKVSGYGGLDLTGEFVFTAKTDEELSLVCATEAVPADAEARDDGWMMMRIQGVLDFSLIGILAEISSVLAKNRIGLFAISTFNTDYILVKSENYENALTSLSKAGYAVV